MRMIELDEHGQPLRPDAPELCEDCDLGFTADLTPRQRRAVTQDVDLIRTVIRLARDEGYAVGVCAAEPFYRCCADDIVESIPDYEAVALAQLLETGRLELASAHHTVQYGRDTTRVRLVRVPKRTLREETRWSALTPVPTGTTA